MKTIRVMFMFVLLVSVCVSLNAFALSYPPAPLYHRLGKAETVMSSGDTVYMFHSGTEEIKSAIHANDILTVYRINAACEVREVGKIRVISQVGDTYLTGEVVEGEIRPNDIAKKRKVSLLIITAGACGR